MAKFYFEQEDGGIVFRTDRRPGDVRIPNYVYDIWMPIVGSDALGVYAAYCRLEMNGSVKKITQKILAAACRIGTDKLQKINDALVDCGFVTISKPEGHQRLMHYTVEVVVHDPPMEVSKELIDKYAPHYTPLTPWFVTQDDSTSENLNGFSGDPEQGCDENLNRDANFASLGLHPLEVEAAEASSSPEPLDQEPLALNREDHGTKDRGKIMEEDKIVVMEDHASGLSVLRDDAIKVAVEIGPRQQGFRCQECGVYHKYPTSKTKRRRPEHLRCAKCGALFAVTIVDPEGNAPGITYEHPNTVQYYVHHPLFGEWTTDETGGEDFILNWRRDPGRVTELIAWAVKAGLPPNQAVARINTAFSNQIANVKPGQVVAVVSPPLPLPELDPEDEHVLF